MNFRVWSFVHQTKQVFAKLIFTGSSGQIGEALTEWLLPKGHTTYNYGYLQ
jgi:nucleoside-diphosphate-sugar epimerase